jgi:hypothetical protein
MTDITKFLSFFSVILVVGCKSSGVPDIQTTSRSYQSGNEVDKVCFGVSREGRWKNLDNESNSFILSNRKGDFIVDLTKTCDVNNVQLTIGAYGFGRCLKKGDYLIMQDGFDGQDRCHITQIHEWIAK